MIGEVLLTSFIEPLLKRVTVAVRRHVFPSLGITVVITLLTFFLLLNPWFGSQMAKYLVISYMVGSADDVTLILQRGASEPRSAATLIPGAAKAGFYTSADREIVTQWSALFSRSDYVNQKKMDKHFAAILAARTKAELREPPFQPIGLQGIASSPSCEQTRPPTGQVYIRANSYLGSQLNPGDALKISRQDGLGRPVIAVVNKVPDMPREVDMYLNRRQMVDYLASTSALINVRAVITDDLPNQDMEDRYPPDVKINCTKG